MDRNTHTLHISRAAKYGGGAWVNVRPSPFLYRIEEHLPRSPEAPSNWTHEGVIDPSGPALKPPEIQDAWPARAIETYLDCPRRFYYEEVLTLGAGENPTPFLRFQSALRASIAWLRETPSSEERRAGASARLSQDWEQVGPRGHALETIYRTAADQMLATAVLLMECESLSPEVSLTLGGDVVVNCRADHISSSTDAVVVRRFKAGRLSKDEKQKARYVIMQAALRRQAPGRSVEFEHVSLLTGEKQPATLSEKKLLAEIAKIERVFPEISAGDFEPVPSDYKCPRCPYYFICPSHGAIADQS